MPLGLYSAFMEGVQLLRKALEAAYTERSGHVGSVDEPEEMLMTSPLFCWSMLGNTARVTNIVASIFTRHKSRITESSNKWKYSG